MTEETRIKLALDEYDNAMLNLWKEYEYRESLQRVNEAGEVLVEDIINTHAWFIQEENAIKNAFIKAIKGKE